MKVLLEIIEANRAGHPRGIYAVCTAHPVVLEAAFCQGKADNSPMLIEATANQVNQFGGYTGMQPADFKPYLDNIAKSVGFPIERIILGGDHLGPVCWTDEDSAPAMVKAHALIAAYVKAGFKKIHLDTSMPCADDPDPLSDDTVASRAADLCDTAEQTAVKAWGTSDLVYIVGTEVPPPGGATEAIERLQVTPAKAVRETVAAHRIAFVDRGLESAWSRVIGLVVQPGVEFDHMSVRDFVPSEAKELSALISELPNLVYEAHSTDYQPPSAYRSLVRHHFAILKVGPQLTYALREALFALSHIEEELIPSAAQSQLRDVCEEEMKTMPGYWEKYYPDDDAEGRLLRRYSYSDRIRYYWNRPTISNAVKLLVSNLTATTIPLPLLGMFMPPQYQALRSGKLAAEPTALIRHHIMQVTKCYADACWAE